MNLNTNTSTMNQSQLILSVYILTFTLGVPANILAFWTFCVKIRHKPTPMDILLLNLTVSDLIFLMFLPLKMKEAADDMEWNLPSFLCPVSSFFFFSCIYTSTFFLTAVAVERHLAVAFPIQYKVCRRPRYAVIASVLFWLVSSINLSITYIVPSMHSDNETSTTAPSAQKSGKCYDNFENKQLTIIVPVRFELFLVLFLIPFVICCFCYINLIRILSQLPSITRKRRLRAVGLALVTLLLFTVSFAPYNISHVVGFVHGQSEGWRDVALISATLNTCLDPMIFYFSSSTVRKAISCCLQSLMEKMHLLRCSRAQCCPPMAPDKSDIYIETNPPNPNT